MRSSGPGASAQGPTAIAPPVEGIEVDGDLSDWPEGLPDYELSRTLDRFDRPHQLPSDTATFRAGYSSAEQGTSPSKSSTTTRQREFFRNGSDNSWRVLWAQLLVTDLRWGVRVSRRGRGRARAIGRTREDRPNKTGRQVPTP